MIQKLRDFFLCFRVLGHVRPRPEKPVRRYLGIEEVESKLLLNNRSMTSEELRRGVAAWRLLEKEAYHN